MTESKLWHVRQFMTMKDELEEMTPARAGLISDEKMPSLHSISDSFCSDSTIDLETLEQSKAYYSVNESSRKFSLARLKNNFMDETDFNGSKVAEISATESAINMNNSFNHSSLKSLSLLDVSNILPSQLNAKLTSTVSCETIHSQSLSSTTKSKDSGFQRSTSCLSLNSGRRKYDHIESKVKAYIRNIKESEAIRKKNKLLQQSEVVSEPTSMLLEVDSAVDKEDLVLQIQELKNKLHDKALFIDTQQRNYNSLLLKYAAAKNTIDSLRFQKFSLNYSSSNNETKSTKCGDISFVDFEQEINKKLQQMETSKESQSPKFDIDKEITSAKDQICSPLERTTSFINAFEPMKSSTPQTNESRKCLEPVSKIFSSSSRLDTNVKPLDKLKKQLYHSSSTSEVRSQNHSSQQCPVRKSNFSSVDCSVLSKKVSDVKTNWSKKDTSLSDQKKHNSVQIDLPNVDAFDKVKKWQASLPSINLLDNQSSSDEEDPQGDLNIKKIGEQEINCSLSFELMSKLKLSDKSSSNVNSDKTATKKKISSSVSNLLTERPDGTKARKVCSKEKGSESTTSEKNTKSFKSCTLRAKTCLSLRSQVAVTSGSESTSYLPRSSSCTCLSGRVSKDEILSDSNDESSSVSSSVLGSKLSSSITSIPKKSKVKSKPKNSLKSDKAEGTVTSKMSNTKVVLRQPKLNYEPMRNVSNLRDFQNKSCTPKINNVNSPVNLKMESSQRKAWNERNNANFNVCKEFYFKRSSSLQECLNIIQNMAEQTSSIIKSNLERSQRH